MPVSRRVDVDDFGGAKVILVRGPGEYGDVETVGLGAAQGAYVPGKPGGLRRSVASERPDHGFASCQQKALVPGDDRPVQYGMVAAEHLVERDREDQHKRRYDRCDDDYKALRIPARVFIFLSPVGWLCEMCFRRPRGSRPRSSPPGSSTKRLHITSPSPVPPSPLVPSDRRRNIFRRYFEGPRRSSGAGVADGNDDGAVAGLSFRGHVESPFSVNSRVLMRLLTTCSIFIAVDHRTRVVKAVGNGWPCFGRRRAGKLLMLVLTRVGQVDSSMVSRFTPASILETSRSSLTSE